MTSNRLVVYLGIVGLIIGACGTDNPGGGKTGGTGGTSTGGATGTGGAAGTGGATSTGGVTATGGVTNTGGTVGSGGASGTAGATGTGGAGTGGRGGAPSGGAGMGGSIGPAGGGGYPLKNSPVMSAGCGKATTLTSSALPTAGGGPEDHSAGYKTITSGGDQRQYMLTMPPNYDMNKPYRFMYVSHYSGGDGDDMAKTKYHGVQGIPAANESSIWVAASGIGGAWGLKDVPLFDDILNFVKASACVDESRVFVYGFSFGGMYSYSLSMTRQKTIRAGIGMSAANFNIQIPPKVHEPIAWMQSTGMSDPLCSWVVDEAAMKGAKFIAIEHGKDNGCTVPSPIPTWTSGGMLCDDFAGCKAGYPTRVCTWNGPHDLPPGAANWIWDFISQF